MFRMVTKNRSKIIVILKFEIIEKKGEKKRVLQSEIAAPAHSLSACSNDTKTKSFFSIFSKRCESIVLITF